MSRSSTLVAFGKRVASEFSEKNVTFMAASIAYNAFVSLVPLLILLLLTVSLVGGGLEERLIAAARNSLSGPIADIVVRIFSGDSAATSTSVIGLVVLLWGTLKIFRGLDTAFSEIYETEGTNSFADQLVDGLVVLVSLVVSIVATVAISAAFTAYSDVLPVLGWVTPVVLFAGLVIAFFPMYYRFPDADIGWRDALPGAVFAAIGWAALQGLFQVYLVFKSGGTESLFGDVLVVVTWLYFSGLVLLLGAVLNATIGDHSSGATGGVGRGAAQDPSEPETRRMLQRDELAEYLHDLRKDLTGYHAEMQPTSRSSKRTRNAADNVEITELVGTLRTYRPIWSADDEVEVIERTSHDGDEREESITIRWRTTERD